MSEDIEERIARLKTQASKLSVETTRDYSSLMGYRTALARWRELHPSPEVEDGFDLKKEMHYIVKDGVHSDSEEEVYFAVLNYTPHLIGQISNPIDGLSVHGVLKASKDYAKVLQEGLQKECLLWRRNHVRKGLLLVNALEHMGEITPELKIELTNIWRYLETTPLEENAEEAMMGSKKALDTLYQIALEQLSHMVPTLKELMKDGNLKILHGSEHSEVWLKMVEVDYSDIAGNVSRITLPLLNCTFEDYLEDRVQGISLDVELPPGEIEGKKLMGEWTIAVEPMAQILSEFMALLKDVERQIKNKEFEARQAEGLDLTKLQFPTSDPTLQQPK